jgi:hypothetical protein
VNVQAEYGRNCIDDFRIHFSVLCPQLPEEIRHVRVSVYRVDAELNPRAPAKTSNLDMQLEIANILISKKQFHSASIIRIPMKMRVEFPVDIAVPVFQKPEVILGLAKLSSCAVARSRRLLGSLWSHRPYSESVYSFMTRSGLTVSTEQLFSSKYSVK